MKKLTQDFNGLKEMMSNDKKFAYYLPQVIDEKLLKAIYSKKPEGDSVADFVNDNFGDLKDSKDNSIDEVIAGHFNMYCCFDEECFLETEEENENDLVENGLLDESKRQPYFEICDYDHVNLGNTSFGLLFIGVRRIDRSGVLPIVIGKDD